jgi:predicted N-acetyltransferase YhbS
LHEVVEISIRDAGDEDAPAIADLLVEFGYPSSAPALLDRLELLGDDPDSRVLVAALGDEVVGVGAVHMFHILEGNAPLAILVDLIVAGTQRRRGVGATLTQALEREALARGCFGMIVYSGSSRTESHAFYRRVGYEQTGTRFLKLVPQ